MLFGWRGGLVAAPRVLLNQYYSCLLLLSSQVADLQEMLFGWRGGLVATLNAEWDADGLADADLASFVKSFEHIYCFGPLEIQVLPETQRGGAWKLQSTCFM